MRKIAYILIAVLLLSCMLGGCRRPDSGDTTGGSNASTGGTGNSTGGTNDSTGNSGGSTSGNLTDATPVEILGQIWDAFDEGERFPAYGGPALYAVENAPGMLDMANTDEITANYMLPTEYLSSVESGASLFHGMNMRIFTSAAFQLKDGTDLDLMSEALRDSMQNQRWICGTPDRILIASAGNGILLMAYGGTEPMELFEEKLTSVYPDADILFDEAVMG